MHVNLDHGNTSLHWTIIPGCLEIIPGIWCSLIRLFLALSVRDYAFIYDLSMVYSNIYEYWPQLHFEMTVDDVLCFMVMLLYNWLKHSAWNTDSSMSAYVVASNKSVAHNCFMPCVRISLLTQVITKLLLTPVNNWFTAIHTQCCIRTLTINFYSAICLRYFSSLIVPIVPR